MNVWYNRQINYIIWIFPLCFIFLFGDLIIIFKGLLIKTKPETTIWNNAIIIISIPICIKLIFSHYTLIYLHNNKYFIKQNEKLTSTKKSYLQYYITFLDCILLIGLMIGYKEAIMSLRCTWHSIQIIHPISKIVLFVSLYDILEMIFILFWE